MTARIRRWLSAAVRLLIVAAAIGWLATSSSWNWARLRDIIQTADRGLLLAGLLAFGPAPLLIAFRLKWLLAVHDIHLTGWESIKITFGSNFVIWALPVGTSGGDAAKAICIAKDTPHKHEAVTTVFFDRLIGVVSLIWMSGTMVLINWHNPAMASRGRVIGLLSLVFLAGAAAYFSPRIRGLLRLDQLIAVLPLGRHIQRIDRAVMAFRRRGRRVMAALAITVALQAVSIFSLYLMGWGLGLVGGRPLEALPIYFAYTPICFLTGALPLGVMEVTFEELFVKTAHLGPPGAGMLLSILSRFMQLAWALPGALVVLRGGYRYSPEAAREVESDLAPTLASHAASPVHT